MEKRTLSRYQDPCDFCKAIRHLVEVVVKKQVYHLCDDCEEEVEMAGGG